MRLVFPKQFTAATLHSLWARIDGPSDFARVGSSVLVDLCGVQYVDPEGINYVALIPEVLRSRGRNVSIVLPTSRAVLSFLDAAGILRPLMEEYDIISEHWGDKTDQGIAARQAERFLPRGLGTHIARGGTLTGGSLPARFMAMARRLGEPTAGQLAVCFLELTQNVFDHSGEMSGCVTFHLRQFRRKSGAQSVRLFLAVSDLGVGIARSLATRVASEAGKAASSVTDAECLRFAVAPGSSRHRLEIRGWGLHNVRTAADQFRLSSGRARLVWRVGKQAPTITAVAALPGTSAVAEFEVPQNRGQTRWQPGA